ncbi:hypothetical protein FNF27_03567 [Cafeteria roenbergensis]|uniref:AMP-dependent synthetase/ligase domain-containing protein n=1 Tax=Cafeteria roenbergensis TaxID=33653 RepID=A0A5A8EB49_CAFRO|nr:hypothetical protein FNF27_03567 [Cafeteria roenbergensis]
MAASAHKLLPGLAEPSRADAPSRAAALLPLREGPGGVECLFAQSEILNTVLSTAHRLVFHRWPGELRFIGGPKVLGHADPLETMQQELELLGLPLPRGGADVRLFHKAVFTARDRDFEVIVCIIWVSNHTPGFSDASIRDVNAQLAARHARVDELRAAGRLWALSPAERQGLTRKIRGLTWLPVHRALRIYGGPAHEPPTEFVPPGGPYDVIILQECFASPYAPCFCRQRFLVRRLRRAGYRWVAHTPAPSARTMAAKRRVTDSGLLILSRHPIVASDFLTFRTEGLSLDSGASKGVLFARVAVGGGEGEPATFLDVFNCHLQATHSSGGGMGGDGDDDYASVIREARRRAAAAAAAEAEAEHAETGGPGSSSDQASAASAAVGQWPCGWCCGPGRRAAQPTVGAEAGLFDPADGAAAGSRMDPFASALLWALTAVWTLLAAAAFWWVCCVPGLGGSGRRHRKAAVGSRADAFEAVRKQQLHELVRFIQRHTHGAGCPWVLVGDFNVDAIAQDAGEGSGLAFFSGAPSTGESEAYRRLVRALAPLGEGSGRFAVRDLLKLAKGKHVSTRPPRLQFPTSIRYLLRHKYPQRLDYVFAGGGGDPGQLVPDVSSTSVVEFRVDDVLAGGEPAFRVAAEAAAATGRCVCLGREWARPEACSADALYRLWRLLMPAAVRSLIAKTVAVIAGRAWGLVSAVVASLLALLAAAVIWAHLLPSSSAAAISVALPVQDTLLSALSAAGAAIRVLRRSLAAVLVYGLGLAVVESGSPAAAADIAMRWSSGAGLPDEALLVVSWLGHGLAALAWSALAALLLWGAAAQVQPERAWACLWHALFRLTQGQLPFSRAHGAPVSRTHRVLRDVRGGEGVVVVGSLARHWQELASNPASWSPLAHFHDAETPVVVVREQSQGVPLSLVRSTSAWSESLHRRPGRPGIGRAATAPLLRQPSSTGSGRHRLAAPSSRLASTLYEMLLDSVHAYGFRECLGYAVGPQGGGGAGGGTAASEGEVRWLTYSEVLAGATCLGSGLKGLASLAPGDRVGILGFNSKEWLLTELACSCYSLVSVVLHAPLSRSDSQRPLRHLDRMLRASGCAVIVCDRLWTTAIIEAAARDACPGLRAIVQTSALTYDEQIQASTSTVRLLPFEYVAATGRAYTMPHTPPDPRGLSTVTYSFSSDMDLMQTDHTHASVAAAVLRLRAHPLGRSVTRFDVHVSYLALVHEGERCFVHLLLACGAAVGFVGSAESGHLASTVARMQPTLLLVTPALLKSGYAYFSRIKRSWSPGYRMLFETALQSKRQAVSLPASARAGACSPRRDMWADVFIFRVLSDLIGTSRIRFLLVMGSTASGAALDPAVIDFVQLTLCVPVLSAWTCPAAGFRTGMLVHVVAGSGRAAVPGGSLSRSSPAFSEDFVQAVREPSDRLLHPFECIRLLGHASSVVEVEERPDPPPSAPSALRGDSRAEAAAAGQRDGAGQPCSRTSVVCERIEAAHLFADGLIRSLAVLPLPASRGGGLMAVVSVEQEECLMWAVHSPGDDEDPDSVNIVDTVCRRRDFCEHLLGLLRRSAREAGLAPQETVRAVYATTVGITSRNCLSTPAGLLRRSNLALHFGAKEPVAAAD